jgi:predicted RND superfamily exporter protein
LIDDPLLMTSRIDRIERLLTKRNARITLVVIALCTLVFANGLRSFRLDHDFEKFFPTDDPELDQYLAFRDRFGHDNDYLLIGGTHTPTVFDRSFLVAWDDLSQHLGRLDHVVSVTTPTRLEDPRFTSFGVFRIPWLRLDADSTLPADSARIWQDERIRSGFFADDGRSMLMILQVQPGLSKERSDALMHVIEEVVATSAIPGIRMGGRIHGQFWYIQKMQRELVLFFSISVLLLAIFLYVGFRTLWGVLVPIGVVGLSVLWQVGMLSLLGKPISILTMLLPTILFVVGMSDVVHLLERYLEALRKGHSKVRALAITYYEVGLATFLTSVTTSIGFATLLTSGIAPIREFGAYTAMGVLLAFLMAFTLLPAILILVRTPVQAARTEQQATWYPFLHGLFRWILRHRRRIPWAFAAICVACITILPLLKVNNFLLEDWPEDDPQKQDYYWFEDHFGGVRGFEMQMSTACCVPSLWALESLREMEGVQEHVQDMYGVEALLSPVTVVKAMNKAFHGGSGEFDRLPDSEEETARLVKQADAFGGRHLLSQLVTEDGRYARMTGRMRDEGGYIHRQRNAELEAFIQANSATVHFSQTGMAYLIDRNNEKLSAQLILGLLIAFVLIGAIMAFVFRDPRMTVVSLIPNVIPLLGIAGFMGLAGIDIKVSTAIIFTIAFGIAVDDTIHILGKLRIELRKGTSLPFAMKRAFLSAGKAILVTSIMLCSGFVALVFSGFASVHYMGLLVGLTLVFAVVTDLLLLPLLVLFLLRRPSSRTIR